MASNAQKCYEAHYTEAPASLPLPALLKKTMLHHYMVFKYVFLQAFTMHCMRQ